MPFAFSPVASVLILVYRWTHFHWVSSRHSLTVLGESRMNELVVVGFAVRESFSGLRLLDDVVLQNEQTFVLC
ncbi:hypothetical protein F5879DRAFT_974313 [Lentinula edodes]|nr:hypothetical protein F5879DRAFT_974313 [Lentinula edodes]